MDIIGIICEYNPFHNGHVYHIEKIKEMFPSSLIIAVISTSFCQRGQLSILNKWDKTTIALDNGVDLVIELPFVFSSQSADVFARGALKILNNLGCKKIIFGSEINDVDILKQIASVQVFDKDFDSEVKKEIDSGISYPTALSHVLKRKTNYKIDTPNDLLGISYIKEILKNGYDIDYLTIKRTNDYHDLKVNSDIISASAIRNLISNGDDISSYVPNNTSHFMYENTNYFNFLKYKILSDINILNTYQTVDEGIDKRIIKYINSSNDLETLIKNIKTKRYTFNKINRMFIHILTSFTKEEASNIDISYIRVLGFNHKGKAYLSSIKKTTNIPVISSYKNMNDKILDIEYRVNTIYALIVNDASLIKRELEKPIMR